MAEAFNTRKAQCPSCGGAILFRVGSSRAVVCEYCNFVVQRTDQGLETLGRVADLVPTGARLALETRGRVDGVAFTLVGRVQMQWRQGVWDEWYAVFDDGRRGWLAESAGRYHLTFPVSPRPVPHFSALKPGQKLFINTQGHLVVSDLKSAAYVTARGELPEPITVGETADSADLSGPKGVFGTIDYSGDKPRLYFGREVSFDELHVDAPEPAPHEHLAVGSSKVACPQCAGPLELRAPDETLRVGCPYCGALLDATQGGFRVLAELGKRAELRLPLGRKATFFDVEYQNIGWLERTCTVEGVDYAWEEFLLYDAKRAAFRWLVCSDEHWSFVTPVPVGEVDDGAAGALYKGQFYKVFSKVAARVTGIVGELYWAVELGEQAWAVDYVRPPEGLSRETTNEEVNWSHAVFLPSEQVFKAFELKPSSARSAAVGSLEPNPHAATLAKVGPWAIYTGVVAAALLVIFLVNAERTVVFSGEFPVAGQLELLERPDAGDDVHLPAASEPWLSTTTFSEPFVIEAGPRNLQLSVTSNVSNSWAFVSGALINDDTGDVDEFSLESSYYSGADSDGTWVEDERADATYLSNVPAGHYTLRVEAGWPPGTAPPTLRLRAISGVARFWQFFVVLAVIAVVPLMVRWRFSAFEARRWEESNLEGDD